MVVIDPGIGSFAPIAIGATLMILVYAGGHVSAVALAALTFKLINPEDK